MIYMHVSIPIDIDRPAAPARSKVDVMIMIWDHMAVGRAGGFEVLTIEPVRSDHR